MSIHIAWGDDEQTVIKVRFISPWSGPEMLDMVNQGLQMISSVPQTVHIIVDFREAKTQIPTGYLPSVQRLREVGRMNRGILVIVGAPHFIQSLTKLAQEFAPVAYSDLHFAPDEQTAQAMVQLRKQNRA